MNDKQISIADAIITHTSPHTGCVASHILGYLDPGSSIKEVTECANWLQQMGLVRLKKSNGLNQPIIVLTNVGMHVKSSKLGIRQYLNDRHIKSGYQQKIFIIVLVALGVIGLLLYLLSQKA